MIASYNRGNIFVDNEEITQMKSSAAQIHLPNGGPSPMTAMRGRPVTLCKQGKVLFIRKRARGQTIIIANLSFACRLIVFLKIVCCFL